MDFIRSNKTLIIGALVALLVVYGIWMYSGSGTTQAPLTAEPTSSSAAGADLLIALTNLQAVKLDSSIFLDPVFRSLSDFGVDIPSQPVGRSNPFSPLVGTSAVGALSLPQTITSGTARK